MQIREIEQLLGPDARNLLDHQCKTIAKDMLHVPGPDFLDRIYIGSDRKTPVLKSLAQLFNHGRLAGTGYLSILPVDQGIEHSAGASFAPNPVYFDPEHIAIPRRESLRIGRFEKDAAHSRDASHFHSPPSGAAL